MAVKFVDVNQITYKNVKKAAELRLIKFFHLTLFSYKVSDEIKAQ